MQVENVETVLDSVHALYASFIHTNAESSNMQQPTSRFSPGSNEEGRSTTNTDSESHQTHAESSWTISSTSAPTHGWKSSASQPTPSSLGGELILHTAYSRQAVEARQRVPSLDTTCPQPSEESSSPLTVVIDPTSHPEMAPEEHLLDGTNFATPILEAGSETRSRDPIDNIEPVDALHQPGNNFDGS